MRSSALKHHTQWGPLKKKNTSSGVYISKSGRIRFLDHASDRYLWIPAEIHLSVSEKYLLELQATSCRKNEKLLTKPHIEQIIKSNVPFSAGATGRLSNRESTFCKSRKKLNNSLDSPCTMMTIQQTQAKDLRRTSVQNTTHCIIILSQSKQSNWSPLVLRVPNEEATHKKSFWRDSAKSRTLG